MEEKLSDLRRFRGRHFLTDLDYKKEDLEELLTLGGGLEGALAPASPDAVLAGQTPGDDLRSGFDKDAGELRERFGRARGNALYLRPGEIHLPGRRAWPTRPARFRSTTRRSSSARRQTRPSTSWRPSPACRS